MADAPVPLQRLLNARKRADEYGKLLYMSILWTREGSFGEDVCEKMSCNHKTQLSLVSTM